MPVIQCEVRSYLSPEKKRTLIRALTKAVHESTGSPKEHIYVLIQEPPGDAACENEPQPAELEPAPGP